MNEMNLNELSRNQITQMAISYLGLKPKSAVYPTTHEMAFHCPFHKDKTPSMFINFDMGVYNCFSCGKSGSIENLFWELTNTSLYKTLGISNDNFTNYARSQQPVYNYSFEDDLTLKPVFISYNKSDLKDIRKYPECLAYLRKRGISLRVADSMHFKYVEDPTEINTTKFSKRLIIPVYEEGRLISIEGRKIETSDEPKVIYPRNCTVNSLFDISNLNKDDTVYAVEGLMDLAVLRSSSFFKNSTSIFGANLTKRQLHLISQFKKFVYIPDNDSAGEKTVDKLRESHLPNVYILKLPKELNDVSIKDVGDLPKAHITPNQLLHRKWLNYEQKLN